MSTSGPRPRQVAAKAAAQEVAVREAAEQARYEEITLRREKNKREMDARAAGKAALKRARLRGRVVDDSESD